MSAPDPMAMMRALRIATLAARERTGDTALGVAVERGRFSVRRVTYDARGRSTVDVLLSDLSFDETLAALAEFGAS
jgi:hypothetical protein